LVVVLAKSTCQGAADEINRRWNRQPIGEIVRALPAEFCLETVPVQMTRRLRMSPISSLW